MDSLAGMSDVTVLFLVVFLCAQLWYPDAAAPVSIPLSPPEGLLAFHASNVDVTHRPQSSSFLGFIFRIL